MRPFKTSHVLVLLKLPASTGFVPRVEAITGVILMSLTHLNLWTSVSGLAVELATVSLRANLIILYGGREMR